MSIHPHLRHACTGHRAALYCLAQGQSPRHFLSTGGDGWVAEWDIDAPENGQLLANLSVQAFALCATSNWIVAGNMNGGVHWIDRHQPEKVRNIQAHGNSVFELQVWDKYLFSVGGDGFLCRWDLASGQLLERLQVSKRALRRMAFSPTRRELALAASDQHLYLLDADDLSLKRVIANAHTPSVFCLAYSPEGNRLLSGGRDAMLRAWDLEQFQCLAALPAHHYTINHLVFSPDGRLLVTASRDKTIKFWDADSLELLKVVDTLRYGSHPRSVNHLLWLQPEVLVSCSDDARAMIWDLGAPL